MNNNKKVRNAIMIGVLCSVSYLAVYIARNVLSAVTPQMIDPVTGVTNEDYIGKLSALYLAMYAVGQLINGAIGDKIKAQYMISFGLFFAGVTNGLFVFMPASSTLAIVVYGMTGFFLSMIYGPMTKVVAENTDPIHATRCSLGYTFSSFFGSPLAGMLAAWLTWQSVFFASSAALGIMAVVCFTVFLIFEKKGIVKYGQYRIEKQGKSGGIGVLLRHRIIKFSLISIITGVVRTSVVFWLPTYINQALGYTPEEAAGMFTVATLAISLSAFLAVFVYERLGRNMDLTILLMFACSAIFFVALYFVAHPIINLVMMVLAIIGSNAAASMLWSRYCPSLRDTGMVSGATGFLDFLSYMAAAISNIVFANAAGSIGWSNLILVWAALVFIGVLVALPWNRIFHRKGYEW
jgi:sugar phosphate permease